MCKRYIRQHLPQQIEPFSRPGAKQNARDITTRVPLDLRTGQGSVDLVPDLDLGKATGPDLLENPIDSRNLPFPIFARRIHDVQQDIRRDGFL